MQTPPEPLAFTLAETCRISGIGMRKVYDLIGLGVLDARKSGRRTIVMADSLRAYVNNLPPASIRALKAA